MTCSMSRSVEADREADIEIDEDEQICSPYHNTPMQTRQDHYSTPMPLQHSCSLLLGTGLVNISASVLSVLT